MIEIVICVNGKGMYEAYSFSGGEILKITEDGGIGAITKEGNWVGVSPIILEVYAQL